MSKHGMPVKGKVVKLDELWHVNLVYKDGAEIITPWGWRDKKHAREYLTCVVNFELSWGNSPEAEGR